MKPTRSDDEQFELLAFNADMNCSVFITCFYYIEKKKLGEVPGREITGAPQHLIKPTSSMPNNVFTG